MDPRPSERRGQPLEQQEERMGHTAQEMAQREHMAPPVPPDAQRAPLCILCSSVRVHIIAEERRQNGAFRAGVGDATVVSASIAAMSHDASEEFRRCLRERVRLARELAALRAGFATVAEHYERVLRSLQALGVELGITPQDIGHATDPDWGPATLLVYGDERFLKHEQAVIDLLLRKLP